MNYLMQSIREGSAGADFIIAAFEKASVSLVVAYFALMLSGATGRGQTCRDGCHDSNTYQGVDAFPNEATGENNTALGYLTLTAYPTYFDKCTAIGALTVAPGSDRQIFGSPTAIGATALQYAQDDEDTAVGYGALNGAAGSPNCTAIGAYGQYNNYFLFGAGYEDTSIGSYSLYSSIGFAGHCTSIGSSTLYYNDSLYITADGYHALYNNGREGSSDTSGSSVGLGNLALSTNTEGGTNVAIGDSAGINLTTGSNNIDIGNKGVAGESNAIRLGKKGTQTSTCVAGVRGSTVASGVGVLVDSNGRLGTVNSSIRYKEQVQPMGHASEVILSLQPVTFRYKWELDPCKIPQFGLIAEQVENIDPDLVARDDTRRPFTVRYEAVNAMLLNEFQKQHRIAEEQNTDIVALESVSANEQTRIAAQQKEIKELTADVKRCAAELSGITDRLARCRSTPRVLSQNP